MRRRAEAFDVINVLICVFAGFVTLFPFYRVFITSFVSFKEYITTPVILFPKQWTLQAYKMIFQTDQLAISLRNTTFITVFGTLISLSLTALMAYPMSKSRLPGIKVLNYFIIIPMMFGGGLIPFYFVVRSLGLLNSLWALILPSCLASFNIILTKNFFMSLPPDLEESAKLDGANDLVILFRIILPLSKPILATMCLFYGVGYWNTYFNAILFLTRSNLYPLQYVLRQLLVDNSLESIIPGMAYFAARAFETSFTLKMAVTVVSTVPIICVYPFLQRYYVQGIMLGAVKG